MTRLRSSRAMNLKFKLKTEGAVTYNKERGNEVSKFIISLVN